MNNDYLRRCKESSTESKLEWLAAAVSFGKAKKVIVRGNESSKKSGK